jgi:hypothetical protein
VCFAENATGKAVLHEAGASPMTMQAGPTPIEHIMIFLFVSSKGNFYSILLVLEPAQNFGHASFSDEGWGSQSNGKTEKGDAIR